MASHVSGKTVALVRALRVPVSTGAEVGSLEGSPLATTLSAEASSAFASPLRAPPKNCANPIHSLRNCSSPEIARVLEEKRVADRRRLEQIRAELVSSFGGRSDKKLY